MIPIRLCACLDINFFKRPKDDFDTYGFQISLQHEEEAQAEPREELYFGLFRPRFGFSATAVSLTLIVSLGVRLREEIYILAVHKWQWRQKPHLHTMTFWK